jgi:hypothetical protein
MSFEELEVHALIVDDPQGILDQQLRPHPINILDIIKILISGLIICYYYKF